MRKIIVIALVGLLFGVSGNVKADTGFTIMFQPSEPFGGWINNPSIAHITLTNDSQTDIITAFTLSIGDTSQFFDFAVNEEGVGIDFILASPDNINDGVTGSELLQYSFTGFAAASNFQFDVDIDPDNHVGYGRPYSETLFDVNGTNSSDNSIVTVSFLSGAMLQGQLPDFVQNPARTYSYSMSSVTPIVPEPISSVLFLTGGGLLAGKRYLKSRTKKV